VIFAMVRKLKEVNSMVHDEVRGPKVEEGDRYVNVSFVAERFSCSKQCIWRWVREGHMPRPIKLGCNMTRWLLSDLRAWEAQRREMGNSQDRVRGRL
jgi:prophage regulatory protein